MGFAARRLFGRRHVHTLEPAAPELRLIKVELAFATFAPCPVPALSMPPSLWRPRRSRPVATALFAGLDTAQARHKQPSINERSKMHGWARLISPSRSLWMPACFENSPSLTTRIPQSSRMLPCENADSEPRERKATSRGRPRRGETVLTPYGAARTVPRPRSPALARPE